MVTTLEPIHTRNCTVFRGTAAAGGATVLTTAAMAPPAGADPTAVGYFAARLVLMRILALGAEPTVLMPAGCAAGGWDPGMVAGIRQALAEVQLESILAPVSDGHGPDGNGRHLTLTAMGVAAEGLMAGRARAGDALYVAGHPMDTPWSIPGRGRATLPRLSQLRALRPQVSDCVPAESGGIAQAVEWLAQAAGLAMAPVDALPGWIWNKPAGAGTCLVVAVPRHAAAHVMALPIPVTHIGTLVPPPPA